MPSETIESFLEIAIWVTISSLIFSLSINLENIYSPFVLKNNVKQLMEILIHKIDCAFLTRTSLKMDLPKEISGKDFKIIISNSKIIFLINNEIFYQYALKISTSNIELFPGEKYDFSYNYEINGVKISKCD